MKITLEALQKELERLKWEEQVVSYKAYTLEKTIEAWKQGENFEDGDIEALEDFFGTDETVYKYNKERGVIEQHNPPKKVNPPLPSSLVAKVTDVEKEKSDFPKTNWFKMGKWTTEEIQTMVKMREEKKPWTEIADILQRTPQTLMNKMNQIKKKANAFSLSPTVTLKREIKEFVCNDCGEYFKTNLSIEEARCIKCKSKFLSNYEEPPIKVIEPEKIIHN